MRRGAKPARAKGESKAPVAGKSGKGEGSRVGDLEKRLAEALKREAEALEQQTATAEILRVISSSPTDVQPVFSAILANALRLCGADQGGVYTFDGHAFRVAAISGKVTPEFRAGLASGPIPPGRETPLRRVALERRPIQVADIQNDPGYSPPTIYRAEGMRTTMAVPLLKEGELIGALTFHRREVRPFTEQQMSMVQTFADQAVIAIENVRLFTELQASNRDLTTALDQQTATGDILRVISQSQTDVQPVFQAILDSSKRLLGAFSVTVAQRAGGELHLAALSSVSEASDATVRAAFPFPITDTSSAGPIEPFITSILSGQPVVVSDAQTQLDIAEVQRDVARARGFRSQLVVPMLREQHAIGVISVTRREAGGFTQDETALLQTFADQAVIAIENVRLFKELQASNRELTTALDHQTATSDILGVISRSQADVQPVFEAIAENAARLVQAWSVTVLRWDGEFIHLAAERGGPPGSGQRLRDDSPWLPNTTSGPGRCIATGTVIHVPDVDLEPADDTATRELAHGRGWRSNLCVPMLRDGSPIGAISVTRVEAGPFSPGAIELLETFADQAVIAIENARLLSELQASNRELTTALDTQTATSDILRAISRSQTDVQPVFQAIVDSAARLLRGNSGVLSRIVGDQIELAAFTRTGERGRPPRVVLPDIAPVERLRDPAHPRPGHRRANPVQRRRRGNRSQSAVSGAAPTPALADIAASSLCRCSVRMNRSERSA